MLEVQTRRLIEAIRRAKRIQIVINDGLDDEISVAAQSPKHDITKLTHDIAIALQDYFNKNGGQL